MPLALNFDRADAESARTEPPERSPADDREERVGPLLERASRARVQAQDHILVLGRDSLSLALALWRAGFCNVGCAPRNLDCVAHGVADVLIAEDAPCGADLDRLMARARFMLRERGWLFLHHADAAQSGVPRLSAQLVAAGFVVGDAGPDGLGGLWMTARRRAALRVVGARPGVGGAIVRTRPQPRA